MQNTKYPSLIFNQPPDNSPNYYEEYLKDNGFKPDVSHGFLGNNPALQIQEMHAKHEGSVESTIEYFVAHETNRLIDKSINQDKPFFIWANFWGAHSPSIIPEPYYSMYDPKDIKEHPSYKENFNDKPYDYYLTEKMWGLGNKDNDSFVYLQEVMPTILDIAGTKPPKTVDGESLLPLMDGTKETNNRTEIFGEFHSHFYITRQRMVRDNRYQFTFNESEKGELYDFNNDPYQLNNLCYDEKYTDIKKEYTEKLSRHLRESNNPASVWFHRIKEFY